MAQIVTITNPLTGQPTQVDQLDHTAQEIDDGIGFESTDYPGCYYRTVDGVTEWVNPPMVIGDEYRTTERHLGKPVYVMAVDFKELPNATTRDVEHGIANIENVISAGGTMSNGGAIPYHTSWTNIDVGANTHAIFIKTAEDQSDKTAVTWIAYTKTTD